MDIDFLHDFSVIAEHENITIAAEILNISPSALSNNLHKLEKELGYMLFDRTAKGIKLNDSGRYFLKWVRKNRDFSQKIIMKLHESTTVRGVLKIGAVAETDTLFILIAAFQKRYPEIRVDVYNNSVFLEQPLQTDLDVFLLPEKGNTLPGIVLGRRTSIFVLMHSGHVLANKKKLTMDDLRDQPFVICANDRKVDWIYEYCRLHGFQPRIQILCENINRKIDIISETEVLALSYNTLQQLRKSICGLCSIPLETEDDIDQRLILAWREKPLNPLADLFSDFAREFEANGRDAYI
ncbi:LysR family transcriptional regulator [Oribacterium sp. HCP28S3_H8]|jgi:DNA-binding transcriptional LysR family regulator|uniref:LysR family transcriptional regulator n=1 Tax=Oribacterium sp. HCP28S3_H8 TaxID=3438945 RepID=UPI003F8B7EE3